MKTIADQYYIKALDNYPFNLEEVMENLNYALSSNQDHAGANYLLAKLYMEQLNQLHVAENYFSRAMASNPDDVNICMDYILLLVKLHEADKARKLMAYTQGMKAVDLARMLSYEALILEQQHKYDEAIDILKKARMEAFDDETMDLLNNALKRVKMKSRFENKALK